MRTSTSGNRKLAKIQSSRASVFGRTGMRIRWEYAKHVRFFSKTKSNNQWWPILIIYAPDDTSQKYRMYQQTIHVFQKVHRLHPSHTRSTYISFPCRIIGTLFRMPSLPHAREPVMCVYAWDNCELLLRAPCIQTCRIRYAQDGNKSENQIR